MYNEDSMIIHRRRTGKKDDPFIEKDESLVVNTNGKVDLTEQPDKFNRVIVTGENTEWSEITRGIPNETQYKVDYAGRAVTFNSTNVGKQLNFNYLGTGNTFISVKSVYTKQNNGNVVETLDDIVTSGQSAIENIKEVNMVINNAENAILNANESAEFAKEATGKAEEKIIELHLKIDNADNLIQDKISEIDAYGNSAIEDKIGEIESRYDSKEVTWIDNETQRNSQENIRISNEEERLTNEEERQTAEEIRANSESIRALNEDVRISNELNRESNEADRETSEAKRQFNEEQRQIDTSTALNNVNEATINAQSLIDSSVHLREYNSTTSYIKNNQVRHNGSTWRCMINCTGVTPAEGEHWTLVAQRGIDGTGSVTSVGGISPDDNGNVPLTASDFGALSSFDIGVNIAGFNEQGQVLDKNGNAVEGKVKSVNGISPNENGDISIQIPDTSEFATQSELSAVDNKNALLSEDVQTVDGKIDDHLSDYMPHDSGLSEFASNPDVNGVYTTVDFKRSDGTLYLKSVLSNPNGSGNYQTVNWKFYSTDGSTEALVVNWTITYDESGVIMKKEVS
ncbi:hypothetical protein [Bacillus sp. UMB0728]|uniref:hypothetical protein n=1 Tax=Bacillus sp. UMB0728 TaxID=2066052 RepID=UPI000C77E642|nr:hypothetical protein [Bacillus sp. UMB0728]PLR72333.1 hypothetical protein CYJ37_12315 [Bacillus sp. UMB0728]